MKGHWQRPPRGLNGWGWQTEHRLEHLERSDLRQSRELAGLQAILLWGKYMAGIAASLVAGMALALDPSRWGEAVAAAIRLLLDHLS